MTELWTSARSRPQQTSLQARRAEEEGWDGVTFTDSQSMSGDVYVALATAAAATSTIRLGTGVTNPWTRHAAVTASAISCVQVESGGRAELGIGRGDSSMARLGLAPSSPVEFRDFVSRVQTYLRGESVPIDTTGLRRVEETQTVGGTPTGSRLEWYDELPAFPKVPVFAVASGPRVMDIAAEVTDRVALVLGADTERLAWGVERVRTQRPGMPISAFVSVVPHPDIELATNLAAGISATFARYSAMHGTVSAPAGGVDPSTLESVARGYELDKHFRASGHQAQATNPEFVRQFVIVGPSGACVERLQAIAELGIDRLHISSTTPDVDADVAEDVRQRLVRDVLPQIR